MKKMRALAVLALALSPFAAGCGDDEENGQDLTLALVAGDWTAISVRIESDIDPNERVDIINDLNGTYDLTIDEGGAYDISIALPGEETDLSGGTVSVVNGDELRFDPDDDLPDTAEARLSDSGNRLTLEFDEAEYDFDENGTEEEATARLILVRL